MPGGVRPPRALGHAAARRRREASANRRARRRSRPLTATMTGKEIEASCAIFTKKKKLGARQPGGGGAGVKGGPHHWPNFSRCSHGFYVPVTADGQRRSGARAGRSRGTCHARGPRRRGSASGTFSAPPGDRVSRRNTQAREARKAGAAAHGSEAGSLPPSVPPFSPVCDASAPSPRSDWGVSLPRSVRRRLGDPGGLRAGLEGKRLSVLRPTAAGRPGPDVREARRVCAL